MKGYYDNKDGGGSGGIDGGRSGGYEFDDNDDIGRRWKENKIIKMMVVMSVVEVMHHTV